jgi:hypothetical protein
MSCGRDYIIAATENQPDATAALNRLMKNQQDIGNAVAKFYGDNAGRQLTTLLKNHIAIAGDIVKAAMAGDSTRQKAADDRWHQNARKALDAVYDHILMMSDALSDGIVKQFPDKFGGEAAAAATSGSRY